LSEDDIHIIQGIQSGSERSYARLFDSYYSLLSVFACKYVDDLEVAREIVQDLFVHLYEHRESLVITTSLKSYLYHSVRNRCLNHLKHTKIHEKHMDALKAEADESMDPEALYQETELEYRVFQIVSGLPSRCKEIFTLSRVEGKKNSEIAARLKISIRTVETQISKAIKILRQKLE
jgi:RNA polymerase sigma-70 factor (family 1)